MRAEIRFVLSGIAGNNTARTAFAGRLMMGKFSRWPADLFHGQQS
jgi:hypothetical protein